MFASTRLAIVAQSLADILARLEEVPSTPEVRALKSKARGYESTVLSWQTEPPTKEQRAEMLKCVLELNVEVMAVARQSESELAVPEAKTK